MTVYSTITAAPRALPEQLNAWCRQSGVGHCETCDDTGMVASHRRPTIDDPYPEAPCDDCDGNPQPCEVCGNILHIKGWDCLPCSIVIELPASHLDLETSEILAKSLARAIEAAAAHRAKVRAQVRECVA